MIRRINSKDESNFIGACKEIKDPHEENFITENNKRLFLSDSKVAGRVFKDCIKKGDIAFIYDAGDIQGIGIIIGFHDKGNRKYIKILSNSIKISSGILKAMLWEVGNIDLWAKVKKVNPLKEILQNNGFFFLGDRGKEVLLLRKGKNILKEKIR